MLGREYKSPQPISETNILTKTPSTPKYPKPKILLIDIDDHCAKVLQDAGYNISIATFGTPYKIKQLDDLPYVSLSFSHLPNYEEQEIIIINILTPNPIYTPFAHKSSNEIQVCYQLDANDLVNPRPLAMYVVRPAFDKILKHGGIFIVFSASKEKLKYHFVSNHESIECSNWDFLSELMFLGIENHFGHEIIFEPNLRELTALFSQALEGAEYHCTLSPGYNQEDYWISLAKNKYGEDVAGMLFCKYKNSSNGCIIVLPQMPNAHQFLVQLLENWCSQWNPALFPYLESNRWIHRPEYEMPKVIELQRKIERVKTDAEIKVKNLEEKIEKLQRKNADWYTLLQGSGDELVQAVIRSLKRLGFQKVIDVDAEAEKEGERREDIQIHDRSPILIIDVKGIQGHPDDDESRQAEKHAIMRMREWDRTDVQPLTIINHQRHLPPHDRDEKAYRDKIIEYAKQTGLGLMTTWDLFKLLRNAERLGWSPEMIQPIFYRVGRIECIPEHYKEIGKIVKIWEHAFGIIPTISISVYDRLAVEVEDTFLEFDIESLQIDNEPIQTAPAESRCGVKFCNASEKIREGARVFLVISKTS